MTEDHIFTDALGNSVSGAAQMISGWQDFLYAYRDYRVSVAQVFAKNGEVAIFGVAEGRWRVEGKVSAQAWKVNGAWLAKVVDAKVERWRVFCDTGWAKPRCEVLSPAVRMGGLDQLILLKECRRPGDRCRAGFVRGVARGRKVRTPQGSVPDNVRDLSVKAQRRPVQQKANRQFPSGAW
jgi:hypothetical protein